MSRQSYLIGEGEILGMWLNEAMREQRRKSVLMRDWVSLTVTYALIINIITSSAVAETDDNADDGDDDWVALSGSYLQVIVGDY